VTKRLRAIPLALAALAVLAFAGMVLAENVDPNNDNSQFAWSENRGWLNAEPANCNNCGVHVTNTGLSGYVWGENIGWVNLSCRNNNACSGPGGNWGVTNNGSGALSGYAWAENAGWISFSCQNNPSTCAGTGNYGVTVSPSTGVFSGYAWGENIGWISFSDTTPIAYKVQTSDGDGDGVFAGSDNCPGVANDTQVNPDGDAFGSACDACPATANPASCADDDNDGFTDADEAAIGTNPGYPCGTGGWPANINDSPGPPSSFNRLDVQDILSFVAPVRRLDSSPPSDFGWVTPDNLGRTGPRWDLVPGPFVPGGKYINIQDILAMLGGSTGNPPMFGGSPAFNRTCPSPP
jgi:hypothetical protein